MNTVFRGVHLIKGAAGFLGLSHDQHSSRAVPETPPHIRGVLNLRGEDEIARDINGVNVAAE